MKNKLLFTLITLTMIATFTGCTNNNINIDTSVETKEEVQEERINTQESDDETKIKDPVVYTVSGIKVFVEKELDGEYLNEVMGWISDMPTVLTKHINSINIVYDIYSYRGELEGVDYVVAGFQQAGDIFLNVNYLSKETLYHEAGHALDYYSKHNLGGYYSDTDVWDKICKEEWANEGYYSTNQESFAEAISCYYMNTLDKEQSKKAIEEIIDNGFIKEIGTFRETDEILFMANDAFWLYEDINNENLCDDNNRSLMVAGYVKAIEVNENKSWYKVDINGQTGYVNSQAIDGFLDNETIK